MKPLMSLTLALVGCWQLVVRKTKPRKPPSRSNQRHGSETTVKPATAVAPQPIITPGPFACRQGGFLQCHRTFVVLSFPPGNWRPGAKLFSVSRWHENRRSQITGRSATITSLPIWLPAKRRWATKCAISSWLLEGRGIIAKGATP